MAVPVLLPRFNMEMEEGTVLRWIVAEGQPVREGDPLCQVETDKVNMEVESPAAGVLAAIRVPPGGTVPVTSILAYVAADEAEASGLRAGEAAGPRDAEPAPA
ncbi:MAG: lipoyl domain-containing protein, partial [Candidatus Dormibacteraceae bacterium]